MYRYLFRQQISSGPCCAKSWIGRYLSSGSQNLEEPGVIPPEVLTLKEKVDTEIIYPKEYKGRSDVYFMLCKFWVTAIKEKSPNKPVMKIEASFYTSFSYDLDDSDFKDFKPRDPEEERDYSLFQYLYQITPISTAWPYWREFVQNMSTRMGFPALMVPLLKILLETVTGGEAMELSHDEICPVRIASKLVPK